MVIRPVALVLSMIIQVLSLIYFLWDMVTSVLGIAINPLHYQTREYLQIAATLGLLAGFVMAVAYGRQLLAERARDAARRRRASSEFRDLLDERFSDWRLSPAERDVALFVIKGFSTAEVARLRQTSEGTVKAQTAAIYRKAGLGGRSQLLAVLIEDLVGAPSPMGEGGEEKIAVAEAKLAG